MDRLKYALTSAPILSFPDGEAFILDTDASGFGIGAVLSQIQGQEEKVITCCSCSLTKPECNYCMTRKELLAVRGVTHKELLAVRGMTCEELLAVRGVTHKELLAVIEA